MSRQQRPKGFYWGLIIILLLLSASGCWDQRPVETRAAVTSIGVDPGHRPGLYRFTVVFPNVTTTAGTISTVPANQEYFHETVQAPSLLDAFQSIQRRQSRSLYLGQVRVLALSTHLAPQDWHTMLEEAAGAGKVVLTFVVVGTNNAHRLVTLIPPTEAVPELALYRALTCNCQPVKIPNRAWHVWDQMNTPGVTPIVIHVSVTRGVFSQDGLDLVTPHHIISWPFPTVVGWAYLLGRVRKGMVTIPVQRGTVIVARIHGTAHLSSHPQGSLVSAVDQLTYTGRLAGGHFPVRHLSQVEHQLTPIIARRILALCDNTWHQAQRIQADPFGWHRSLLWQNTTEGFRTLTTWKAWHVTFVVHFHIHSQGVLQ